MDYTKLLGDDAQDLLTHDSKGIPADILELPGPDFVDRVFMQSDRSPQVLRKSGPKVRTGLLRDTRS